MTRQTLPAKTFVVDNMLGKVAKWLRILGYDAIYQRLDSDCRIEDHLRQGRIPVTRNSRWRNKGKVIFIQADDFREQLRELIETVGLSYDEAKVFSRCLRCNEVLQAVSRQDAVGRVPDYVWEIGLDFHRCPRCGRIYWPGTHPQRMKDELRKLWG